MFHIHSTRTIHKGPETQNIQRIMLFKDTSFPFPSLQQRSPKEPASSFLPSAPAPNTTLHLGWEPQRLLALPESSLSQVQPSTPGTTEFSRSFRLGSTLHM